MSKTIFISYRSKDSGKVDDIAKKLRLLKDSDGKSLYRVWQDKNRDGDGIPPGAEWWDSILDAIEECSVFIFMISKESMRNVNCLTEFRYAYAKNRHIIPIILGYEDELSYEDGKYRPNYITDMPENLRAIQYLVYDGHQAHSELERELDNCVKNPRDDEHCDRPPSPDGGKTAKDLYDEAYEFANQMQYHVAIEKFQLLNRKGKHTYNDAPSKWIEMLTLYQRIDSLSVAPHNEYFAKEQWKTYCEKFSNIPFVPGRFFDPQNFKSRYSIQSPVIKIRNISSIPEVIWVRSEKVGDVTIEGINFVIATFYISKNTITNSQYQKFLNADDGYYNPSWWNLFPEEFRPQPIKATYNKNIDAPRDRISWYQSIAFANWLDAKYRQNGLFEQYFNVPTDQFHITIPPEWYWKWAEQKISDDLEYQWDRWEWCFNSFTNTQTLSPYSNDDEKVMWAKLVTETKKSQNKQRRKYHPYGDGLDCGFRLVVISKDI